VNKKTLLTQAILVILCLTALESVCWVWLKTNNLSVGYLVNFDYFNEVNGTKGFGFNEIDSLCGWAMSNARLENMGYETEHNCIVLRSKGTNPSTPLKIFITGGSTSDIALHKENWPVDLHQLLVKNKINAILYVGAVGGYTSGQELLKLLRDGVTMHPDIHISYAGANEGADLGYVSEYEYDFYHTAYRESLSSKLLPSTVLAVRKLLGISYYDLSIKPKKEIDPFIFWQQNVSYMHAAATAKKTKFIGLLQPVLAVTKNSTQSEKNLDPGNYGLKYKQYYPLAQEYIRTDGNGLYDLSGLFDTIQGQIYIDDCHINTPYQKIVANAVFNIIKNDTIFKQ